MKEKCLFNPKVNLFLITCKNKEGIYNIFRYICFLKYEDKPNSKYIYDELFQLRLKELKAITYNYEYNQSFLGRKMEREDEGFCSNDFHKYPKYNNNITINNPTQNQIVIINQIQEQNIEQKFIECLAKFMNNKNIAFQENKNNNNIVNESQHDKNQ